MKRHVFKIVSFISFLALARTSAQENGNAFLRIENLLQQIPIDINDQFNKYDQLLRENHKQREEDRKKIELLGNKLQELFQGLEELKREVKKSSDRVGELGEIRKEKYEQTEKILKNMEKRNAKHFGDLAKKSDNLAEMSHKTLTLLNSGKLKLEGGAGFDDKAQDGLRQIIMESVHLNLHTFKNKELDPEFDIMKEMKKAIDELRDTSSQIRPNCNDHSEEMKIILDNNFKNLTNILENKVFDHAVAVPNKNIPVPNMEDNNPNPEDANPLNVFQPAIRAPTTTAVPIPCNRVVFDQDAMNCAELKKYGVTCDGVYPVFLDPDVGQRFVYCDMTADDGGWTVIARRGDYGDPKTNFDKSWKAYKQGFGNTRKEFWFGNNNMHRLTSQEPNELRVKLESFAGETLSLTYTEFAVGNLTTKFKLKIGDVLEGDRLARLGQSLKSHDGQPFSTHDENYSGNEENCASKYKGGWWFKSDQCFEAIVTGPYFHDGEYREDKQGIIWQSWKQWQVLKSVEMMVRPVNFKNDLR